MHDEFLCRVLSYTDIEEVLTEGFQINGQAHSLRHKVHFEVFDFSLFSDNFQRKLSIELCFMRKLCETYIWFSQFKVYKRGPLPLYQHSYYDPQKLFFLSQTRLAVLDLSVPTPRSTISHVFPVRSFMYHLSKMENIVLTLRGIDLSVNGMMMPRFQRSRVIDGKIIECLQQFPLLEYVNLNGCILVQGIQLHYWNVNNVNMTPIRWVTEDQVRPRPRHIY